MAIVANKADGTMALARDKSYCVYNRSGAGSPQGSVVPQYAGEIYLDTTGGVRYKALSLLNSGWQVVTETTPA